MTLVPQPRLLITLLLGAVLILLVLVHPVFLILFLAYYAALLGFALADGARLPKKSGFMASRVLPQPFSLGEVQSVQVLIAHSEAAGLSAEVADHVPAQVARTKRDFRPGLLHLVFAKQIQTEVGELAHGLRWLALADREQSDSGRVPFGARAGSLDPHLNGV